MRSRCLVAAVALTLAAAGCGSPGADPADSTTAEAAMATAADSPAAQSALGADPCAPLDHEPVRYDAAGKPVAFTFEYPSGWTVDELVAGSVTSLDVTKDIDGDNWPDYVLRFGHTPGKAQDNVDNLVGVWRQLPVTEKVMEIDVDGRAMYLAKNRIGEMTGYQALLPDVTSEARAFLVSGGVVDSPDECEDQAVAAVERILRSLKPNRDIAPSPAE